MSHTLDGRAELAGSLDAEGAGVVEVALRLAMTQDDAGAGDPERSAAERRGDALVDVCRHYLDHRPTDAPPAGTGPTSTSSSATTTSPPAVRDGSSTAPRSTRPPPNGSSATPTCTAWSSPAAPPSSTTAGAPAPFPRTLRRAGRLRRPLRARPVTASRLVRSPPRHALGRRRRHRPGEPGPALRPAPPPLPPPRLAPQTHTRRHPRRHRPHRPSPHHRPTRLAATGAPYPTGRRAATSTSVDVVGWVTVGRSPDWLPGSWVEPGGAGHRHAMSVVTN